MADDNRTATEVLSAMGGVGNVRAVEHCMTRLRFTLKDDVIPQEDVVKAIDGVLGVQIAGGQYQVIIGQNVRKVYQELIALPGMSSLSGGAVDAPASEASVQSGRLTPRVIGKNVLNYLSGSMVQLIPLMIAAAMFRTVTSVFGPSMLGVLAEDSDLYILCNAIYQAGFYFMPIYLGYAAAKTLNVSLMMGMLMGGVLISPELIARAGEPFTVYGVPTTLYSYAQTVLPILLTVWVMMYVERFFKKFVPDILSTIFVPVLTIAVMVPVALCALAPLGNWCSLLLSQGLAAFNATFGFIATAICGGLWELIVMSGMHVAIGTMRSAMLIQDGSVSGVFVAERFATVATWGMALGAFLRLRSKKDRATAFGCFVSGIVGGVTEPALFGIALTYKRPLIGLMAGGFAGALYAGITHVTQYVLSQNNILILAIYTGGDMANFVNGCIGSLIAFVVAMAVTYVIGFKKEDVEAIEAEENAEN